MPSGRDFEINNVLEQSLQAIKEKQYR